MSPSVIVTNKADLKKLLATLTCDYDDTIRFYLNGTKVTLDDVDPEITLLEYLRGIGKTGTKLGCAEGGCGACTVVISQYNPTTKKIYHASVNACLAPLISIDGKHVITVEGIGSSGNPHPIQERFAKGNGSQCGFCTPGIVMSMYALLRNTPEPSELEVEEAFDGNLCRCTGYRPILDAAQSFSKPVGCCMVNVNSPPTTCCMTKANRSSCLQSGDDATNPAKIFSSPEFIPYNADTELIFPPQLKKHQFGPLVVGNKRKRWYRPVSIQQLLEIKKAYPAAKIIGGSTETQIETKFKAMNYEHSVYVADIAELRNYSLAEQYVELGGNVSLTDVEHIMKEAIQHYGPVKSRPFQAILKQIKYFAGRQIKNVGTPAGNLATASPISDLNPVFMATNSTIIALSHAGETEIPLSSWFKGYRKTSLPEDAIIASIRIPVFSGNMEFLNAYKQAKRKDDDIAIVNAALRIKLDRRNVVENSSLIYGGMAPSTVAAKTAETYLKGKNLADPKTLEGTFNALGQDFDLTYSVPGGMASYRKALAFGFFFRFYHEVLSQIDQDSIKVQTQAIGEMERMISTGKLDREAAVAYEKRILGKSEPHVAAMKQVTGEAQYTDDIPVQHNELFGSVVFSTHPHANISVDPEEALALPGVVEWVDHNDLPHPKANYWGGPAGDEIFFAVDKVFAAGQPIGIILAKSAKQAEAGARAVRVQYDDLPAIISIEEAIEKNSFYDHDHSIIKGDVEASFASCHHVFTGSVRMAGQEHFYLETQACVVVPKPEDGEMEVFSSTQNPAETQEYIAQVTGVAHNKIVCRVKRLGGGFGGKETRSVQLAALCAVGAKKTKRPVRCMLNRDDDMISSGQRHPFLANWKVGVNKDGKVQAYKCEIFNNAGWSQDLSASVFDRALSHSDNVYNIPNFHVSGRVAKTNTVSNTAYRGFGGPQGLFICETMMEELADHLGIPILDLRLKNMYKEGDLTHYNQELKDWYVPLMWDQVYKNSDYAQRAKAIEKFNSENKYTKRGISLLPTKYGISFTALFLNQAGALVHINKDGSVLLAHGGVEMGQGLHTKMKMIAAEALRVSIDDVHIAETATNTVANASPTAASASSDLNGYAILNACDQLNERLKPIRDELGVGTTMAKLAHEAYFRRVNLSANGFYKTPDIGYQWGDNSGLMYFYFTQGVAAAEVEIDTLTGSWTCLRADICMDVGRSINPAIDYGQIQGAFIQGQGLFTTEEPLWLRSNGQMFTRGPGNYKIPGFRDIPQEFNVSILKDVTWQNLRTIQRSRGVGEPPLFLGSVVLFAVRDAIKASRREWGQPDHENVLNLCSPATVERIRTNCPDPIMQIVNVVPKQGEKSFFTTQ